jgi:hypothetical protein
MSKAKEATTPEVAPQVQAAVPQQGTEIYGAKNYALTGGAILAILDVLTDELPIRFKGTKDKVELLLAQAKEIRIEG